MKKTILTLLLLTMAFWVHAQNTLSQPEHFIGRRLNASGEVTKEYEANYAYSPEGKLSDFSFPDFSLSSHYTYEDDYLTYELIRHDGGYPLFYEDLSYHYEEGRIKSIFHGWDAMNTNECWIYTYDDNGRLSRKDYGGSPSDITNYFEYDYDYGNGSLTRVEKSYLQTLQGWQAVWAINKINTYQYSDDYTLLSVRTDTYNYQGGGELTGSRLLSYHYSSTGNVEEEITQTLTNGEWVNTSIRRYVYDDQDRVVEQQDGTWSEEDWNITHKVDYEFSDNGNVYTVSFRKKNGDDWVWDVFNNQTIFFDSKLKEQQRALGYFVYEDMNGSASINQFVFNMINTTDPIYLNTGENHQDGCAVYPNPGKDGVNISAPIENAVVRFYDMQGRLLLAKPFDFQTTVNTGEWAPGIYLWEIWNGAQRETSGKWVKE